MGITAKTVLIAFHRIGTPISSYHFKHKHDHMGRTVNFEMRLSDTYEPLPTRAWLNAETKAGKVKLHSLEGAKYLLFGHVHEAIDGGSASAQIVEVETTIIKASAYVDLVNSTYYRAATALTSALQGLKSKYAINFGKPTKGRVN